MFHISVPHWRRALVASFLVFVSSATFGTALVGSPASSAGDPVIVGAGDIACDPSFGPASSCSATATANLIAGINPTAVLDLGDNQYPDGSLSAYQTIYAPTWGQFLSITHPAVGNHEYLTTGAAGYFQYFGAAAGNPSQGYYSYDLGSWHLIALNSQCSSVGGCGSGSPQESWLRNDLSAHTSQCIIAYWHQPRWSSGMFGDEPAYSTFFADLYNAHADIVMSGHDHDYERFDLQDPNGLANPNGVRQFVAGTGGSNHTGLTTLQANSQVFDDVTFGVLKLTLHVGSYDWQFVPVPGTTFTDSGTQACHNVAAAPATATPTKTKAPTRTPVPTRTATPTRTPTVTPTLKSTATPFSTATPLATATPLPVPTVGLPEFKLYLPFLTR